MHRPEPARGAPPPCRVRMNRALAALAVVVAAMFTTAGAVGQATPAARTAAAPAAAPLVAVRSVEGISEYRLPNGLQVLLIPDGSKPTTTVNLTFRVGSRHENYGETGMAHLLEHLLFKGSKRHPNVWPEFTRRGLAANGSTWFDRTNYTATFAASDDNLRWYLGWLADAMVNSFIARRDLDAEMTVVRNEMEMGENNPQGILFQRMLAAMFDWHNYGNDTIGARTDVENVDIPRLQAFYRLYYQPDNATLVVAGAFDEAQVKRWVAQQFGPIPRPRRTLPLLYTLDPAQDGERSVTLRRVGGSPSVLAAYRAPPALHPDFAAMELLALVLGDAPSGRLHKRLTERQLASGTFGWAAGLADPGFIVFGAQLAPGQDPRAASDPMLAIVEGLVAEPITAEELERARTKWLKAWETAFTNPETVGLAMSEAIAQGDWRAYFLQRDRVREVPLDIVQRVAGQYLLTSNRTLATYVPTARPQRAPAPERVDVAAQVAQLRPASAAAAVEAFDPIPETIERRTQRFEVGGLQVALLPKGARGGAVQATLTLRFGDERSLGGHGSVPAAIGALLDKGTGRLSREQIQDRLDQLRTELSLSVESGVVTARLQSRRAQLPEAIALLGELLRDPAFPPDALEEYRRQMLGAIEDDRREPGALLANTLARHGNPYPRGDVRHVRSFDEIEVDVRALDPAALRAYHARFFGASNGQFAAAGDLDPAAVRAALERAFASWRSPQPFARVPQPPVERAPQRFDLRTPDKQNAHLLVQIDLPINDTHPDHVPLLMANHLLGGGGSSRLWERIREREGLSYDVGSSIAWSAFEPASTWTARAIYGPQNRAKVEAAFGEEIERALRDGFTERELREGQRGLLAFRRLSRSQDGTLAAAWASNLYLGRTFARSRQIDEAIARLTLADVNAALRRYLRPDRFTVGWAGDFPAP
jgi:zinc protease